MPMFSRRRLLQLIGLGSVFGPSAAKGALTKSTMPVFPTGFIPVAGHTAESEGMIFDWRVCWSSFKGWTLPYGGEDVHQVYLDGRLLTKDQPDGCVVRAVAGENGFIQYYLKTLSGDYIPEKDQRLVELLGSQFQTAIKHGHVVYGVMDPKLLPKKFRGHGDD